MSIKEESLEVSRRKNNKPRREVERMVAKQLGYKVPRKKSRRKMHRKKGE